MPADWRRAPGAFRQQWAQDYTLSGNIASALVTPGGDGRGISLKMRQMGSGKHAWHYTVALILRLYHGMIFAPHLSLGTDQL